MNLIKMKKIRIRTLFQSFIFIEIICYVLGHGFLFDPIGRASAWRKHFKTPEDFDDEGLFCGGNAAQWQQNGGKCGICGDAFDGARPHEVGGKFVTKPPTIVKIYEQGDIIDVTVNLTANHRGFFVFQLCPVNGPDQEADEDCLNEYNLEIVPQRIRLKSNSIENSIEEDESVEMNYESAGDDLYEYMAIDNRIDIGQESRSVNSLKRTNLFNPVDLNDHTFDKFKFNIPFETPRSYTMRVKLPNEISCKRCVFRWIYITGNTWGTCGNSTEGKTGCGKQEEFRNCADIQIH